MFDMQNGNKLSKSVALYEYDMINRKSFKFAEYEMVATFYIRYCDLECEYITQIT